jgi:hypothetical protein
LQGEQNCLKRESTGASTTKNKQLDNMDSSYGFFDRRAEDEALRSPSDCQPPENISSSKLTIIHDSPDFIFSRDEVDCQRRMPTTKLENCDSTRYAMLSTKAIPSKLKTTGRTPRWTDEEVRYFSPRNRHDSNHEGLGAHHPSSCSLQDQRLKEAVASFAKDRHQVTQMGAQQGVIVVWGEVADAVGNNRTNVQCLQRYNKLTKNPARHGQPEAIAVCMKGPWTEEEDKKVIELVGTHGARKWSQIAAELPGKSMQA